MLGESKIAGLRGSFFWKSECPVRCVYEKSVCLCWEFCTCLALIIIVSGRFLYKVFLVNLIRNDPSTSSRTWRQLTASNRKLFTLKSQNRFLHNNKTNERYTRWKSYVEQYNVSTSKRIKCSRVHCEATAIVYPKRRQINLCTSCDYGCGNNCNFKQLSCARGRRQTSTCLCSAQIISA